MLVAILILQVFITQILSQMHQMVLAQEQGPHYLLPYNIQEHVQACLQGVCNEEVTHFGVQSVAATLDRQFFNAALTLCDSNDCYQIDQVFSEGSAILKEDRRYHAVNITPRTQ